METSARNIEEEPGARFKVHLLYAFGYEQTFSIYPDDVLPGVFCFCCGMLREIIVFVEEAIDADLNTWIGHCSPAFAALDALASNRMRRCIGIDGGPFATLILEHWAELYLDLGTFFRLSRTRDLQLRSTDAWMINGRIGRVLSSFFKNSAVRNYFGDDLDLRKLAWGLWLGSGVLESNEANMACGEMAVALMLLSANEDELGLRPTSAVMFPVCMAVCDEFGGRDAVAEIAFKSVQRTAMSKDIDFIAYLLPQQLAVLSMLAHCEVDSTSQIARIIREQDGVAKLIEGALNVISLAQDDTHQTIPDCVVGAFIRLIDRLAIESYIHLEQAIQSSLLRIPILMQSAENVFTESTHSACSDLITKLSCFLSHYSIIQALVDQFRNLTTEEEACMLGEGMVENAWKDLKHNLIGSFIMKRMFDACTGPLPKFCNNCANLITERSFLQCDGCMRVTYCSVEGQEMDLKEGRHSESCRNDDDDKSAIERDVPFLHFVANKYVRTVYKYLFGQNSLSSAERTIFVFDATETREHFTVTVKSRYFAERELHSRRM
ncbi:hypothetical protein SCHPADRAFT_942587 [Schizopora paradoxa]|uniref:MYND-type domain-containing protein n=1 Tax=Schizopora paradoxa TaxID=27342 RepID=A0A0H2RGU7_9AGAM|nr:hypothetical protein SCHPADRAFT_942587 [Schizopora paradoxa]